MNLLWLLPVLAFCAIAFFVIAVSRETAPRSLAHRLKFLSACTAYSWFLLIFFLGRMQSVSKWIPCILGLSAVFLTYSVWSLLRRLRAEHTSPEGHRPEGKHKQTFLWQGILILLPVFALAIVAIISLRSDRAAAEREAIESAVGTAIQLSDAVRSTIFFETSSYSTHKRIWEEAAREEGATQRRPNTPKEYAGESLDRLSNMPLREMVFDLEGNLLSPQPFTLPEPPKWLTTLSAQQRALWDETTGFQPHNTNSAERAWSKLLTTTRLPEEARANVEFKLRQLHATATNAAVNAIMAPTVAKGFVTETGLPLEEVQMLHAFRLRPAGWGMPEAWKERFAEVVSSTHPSILVPELLREGERICANDAASKSAMRALRSLWETNERTLPLAQKLVEQHPVNQWRNNAFWIQAEKETFLLSIREKTNELFPNGAFFVRTFPKKLVEEWLQRPLKNSITLPPYADAFIEIDRQNFPLRPQPKNPSTNAMVLAEVKTQPDPTDFDPPMKFRLLLTRPELLHARQQQRTIWAAGLISLAAGAALVGFVAAHRSFQRQLRLNEMKDNFVSSVSHELRAPLASVRLMAEALERERVTEPEKQKEYFKFIGQECRRLSSLVEKVLDFSRIEQGRKHYELEPLDVNKLVVETFKLMLPYAAERSVTLRLSKLPTDSTQPSWDGRAIQQAIINLVDNAIKHSAVGQAVVISATEDPARAVYLISVKDAGPGIPREEQTRIFDRFYRLGSELRRETQGIGIGLSIVKHIIDGHAGRVVVQSEPGQGSTFTLELPFKPQIL